MMYITDEILRAAIERMPPTFDSHGFLQELMTIEPHAYVKELASKLHTKDPILQTHADIASRLLKFPNIEKTSKVPSDNVRGRPTLNQEWRKK